MADNIISEVELEMGISIEHLIDEFGKIRTGRANPSLVWHTGRVLWCKNTSSSTSICKCSGP